MPTDDYVRPLSIGHMLQVLRSVAEAGGWHVGDSATEGPDSNGYQQILIVVERDRRMQNGPDAPATSDPSCRPAAPDPLTASPRNS